MNELQIKIKLLRMGIEEPSVSNIMEFDIDLLKAIWNTKELPKFEGFKPRKPVERRKVEKTTKNLINKIFPRLDQTVDIYDDEMNPNSSKGAMEVLNKYQSLSFELQLGLISPEEAANKLEQVYRKNARRGNIFSIPTVVEPMSMGINIYKGPMRLIGDPIGMTRRMPIYCEKIGMEPNLSMRSVCIYAHELIHALINRHKGTIQNYYDKEFLSVFTEKLIADSIDKNNNESDLLSELEFLRIDEIRYILSTLGGPPRNNMDQMDAIASIQGSLYAGILFGKYREADEQEKARILSQIEAVLNGKIKLNDFKQSEQLVLNEETIRNYFNRATGAVSQDKRQTARDFRNSPMSTNDRRIAAVMHGTQISNDMYPYNEKEGNSI